MLKIEDQVAGVECAAELHNSMAAAQTPFEIHQESSGGENWSGPVHKNRHGQVSLRFRGYRRRDGEVESHGQRATPVVIAHTSQGPLSVAVPKFWENFPRAVAVRESLVEIGFFPRGCADVHELQGGEQKTHVALVAFAPDTVSDPPLAWVHEQLLVYPTADWCCYTGAVPFLEAAGHDAGSAYTALVQQALDPREGFIAKREATDEFGWRNFGDLPADHESAFQPAGHTLVSHYNNQYDAVACFAIHFLRTGDRRWWQLMVDLASHVRDIDIYHTREDKAAYNGGMFWHTLHYFDAGTSSHRTYPANGPGGGGPSAEHNYNLGLMMHYCLTGEPASRREAIGLGEWVLAMEDGRRTVFRWLARGSTGLASQSGSTGYHGPGRGAANSILACLVAHRLTGEPRFAAKANELVRRCIHPADDIEARNLLDVEQRWFYTMFLQVLGVYLQDKTARREFDPMFDYARASLLHYARWMVLNERPYLDRREILEFPTETWPAQDMRKADVFSWAAQYAGETERQRFLERARFFWNYSLTALSGMPTSNYARPMVLVLGNGLRLSWADRSGVPEPPLVPHELQVPNWLPVRFEPQKARAVRRFVWAAAAGLGLLLAGALLLFGRN